MGGIGDYIGKPKGMHWRTFERAMERVNDVEKIILGALIIVFLRVEPAGLSALLARLRSSLTPMRS